MAENGVIHTEHIKKYYEMGDVEVRALNDISLDIYKGELTAIMGPSGSGKSTLMSILGCLDRPTSGKYVLDGMEVSLMTDAQLAEVRNKKIGFVFQSFNLLPRSSALENVMLPTLYSKDKTNAKGRAEEALELVGLGARMNHRPKEMSGGQQQRVAIARALINNPEIIMADEPTGNLDSKSGKEIMELLIKLNQEKGTTIILVTHDPKIGKQVPRVISVFDGMLGSEEEQKILKSWTNPEFSKLTELDQDDAALNNIGDSDSEKEQKLPQTQADEKVETEAKNVAETAAVSEHTEAVVPEEENTTNTSEPQESQEVSVAPDESESETLQEEKETETSEENTTAENDSKPEMSSSEISENEPDQTVDTDDSVEETKKKKKKKAEKKEKSAKNKAKKSKEEKVK